jgi:hypothetical protein
MASTLPYSPTERKRLVCMKKQSYSKNAVLAASILGVALVMSGCGQEAYSPATSSVAASARGTFAVPPKVDILMVEDNSGSADAVQSGLQSQMASFLSNLQSTGWDYHFAAAPLINAQAFTQVAASQYDPNWGSQWLSPFPGASASSIEEVNPNYFVYPSNYTAFISPGGTIGSEEPAFQTLLSTINNEAPGTGFIRPDALLVIVALSNGNDTSGVNYCNANGTAYNGSGAAYPCGQAPVDHAPCADFPPENSTCDSSQTSLNYYYQQLIAAKGAKSLVQFNAVVATQADIGSSCIGSGAYVGSRYSALASDLGGQTFSVCTSQASNILSSLSTNLQNIQVGYETHYLFIASAPDVSSIVVTKYPGGNTSSPEVIPQSTTNGWSYVGYTTVDTINFPVPMDQATGYAIELNGSAELSGSDTASVNYTASGLQNSK